MSGLPLYLTSRANLILHTVYSRLDAPTSEDAGVRSRLDHLSSNDVGWNTLSGVIGSLTKVLTITSHVSVLLAVFKNEKGGREFAALALVQPLILMAGINDGPMPHGGGTRASLTVSLLSGY